MKYRNIRINIMEKEVIIKERVAKNLQVLKLLAKDDINISEKEKTEILKGYTGWGGLREAIYTPSVYRQLKACLSDSPYAKTLFLRKFISSFIEAILAATNNLYLMAK